MNRFFPMPLKKWNVAIVAMLLCAIVARAQDISAEFNNANRLYEQGKYSDAAAQYKKITDAGQISAPLLFNLGNACLRSGEIGRAIVAYRRAETLTPRDPEIQANLQFARDKAVGGNGARKNISQRILGKLTLNEWSVLTAVVVALWFIILAIRQWRRDWRNAFSGFVRTLGILAALLLIALACAIFQRSQLTAVVIVPEAVVRRGPYDESPSAFTLRDGAEVKVLNRKGDWLEISGSSRNIGWLSAKSVLTVNDF